MVEIPDSLHSLFNAEVERAGGRYVVEVPESEVENGAIEAGEIARVGLLPAVETATESSDRDTASSNSESTLSEADREPGRPAPPVDEGEVREVTVETVGDQGDGIAKVERGYVVIVPGAEPGERPTVEIEEVQQNVAFASVVDGRAA